MSVRRLILVLAFLAATSPAAAEGRATDSYVQRTEWIMGTVLRVVLPADHPDRDQLFAVCFAAARRWDALLSPWREQAPLTRLSEGAGRWVDVPPPVLDYLDRAAGDAERSGDLFDITLAWRGSRSIEIDRAGSRARLPAGAGALDPGGDGKGVALDAAAAILDSAGVREAFLDFGGSSFLARGAGPEGTGWDVMLTAADGSPLGVLALRDQALSVSSTVQADRLEDGTVAERFHLRDLRRGETVRARRTAAVVSASATEAEVLSTAAAVLGIAGLRGEAGHELLDAFAGCGLAVFEAGVTEPLLHGAIPLSAPW